MATNPVFPLYYNDMDRSTKTWTNAEYGAYVRLLVHQWDQGSIPEDAERLEMIAPGLHKVWNTVKEKFTQLEPGKLYNLRLEVIRKEREEFSKLQSGRGKGGGNPNFKKGKPNPYYDHKIDEDNPNDKPEDNPEHNPEDKPTDKPIDIPPDNPEDKPSISSSSSISNTNSHSNPISKKKPSPKGDFPEIWIQAMDVWDQHLKKYHDGGKITAKDGKALKKILSIIQAKIKNTELGAPESRVLEMWKVFMGTYPKWETFYKKDITFIASQFENIYLSIKNGKSGKGKHSVGFTAEDINDGINRLAEERFGQFGKSNIPEKPNG